MITITDAVTFNSPEQFESALITLGSIEERDNGDLYIQGEKEGVQVGIESSEADFEICTEEISEDLRVEGKLTRIGIRLTAPVEQAVIRVTIRRMPKGCRVQDRCAVLG
jgi:hypothetical protein